MRLALLCLESRGRVVHARRLELGEPRHVELSVPRAGGDDHGPCCDLDVHLSANQVMAIRSVQLAGFARDGDARAELARLDCGPLGELCPGDSGGEAEVVLDPGRRASLAT